jgi:hypothetical protein
VSFLTG